MTMQASITEKRNSVLAALQQYVEGIRAIYQDSLRAVILYGSYARGDFRPDSDVDIMILVDADDESIQQNMRAVSYMTYDFNDAHDLDVAPIVKNISHFKEWEDVYPFYHAVKTEGVSVYAA